MGLKAVLGAAEKRKILPLPEIETRSLLYRLSHQEIFLQKHIKLQLADYTPHHKPEDNNSFYSTSR